MTMKAIIVVVAAASAITAAYARNRYSDQMQDMSDGQRNAMFAKLMMGSGERCGRVDRSFYRGEARGTALWNIRCTASGSWTISIAPDSSTRILSCSVNKRLKLTPCWTPL